MSNIIIDNIQATEISNWGCSITGSPEQIIENVRLSNIHIQYEGGGTLEDAVREIPEMPESYPSSSMYKILPVYGFFCRHIKYLNLHDISISYKNKDVRPAIYCENINGMSITNLNCKIDTDSDALFVFKKIKDAMIMGCRPYGNSKSFLKVIDTDSENILLFNNDFSKVKKEIVDSNLEAGKITVSNNIQKM
ncbi:MAG: hypothetical protein PHV53_11280, partial [Fermentimonas sp.]|nr:hypothetical protein [Fermentimonas sp.]